MGGLRIEIRPFDFVTCDKIKHQTLNSLDDGE